MRSDGDPDADVREERLETRLCENIMQRAQPVCLHRVAHQLRARPPARVRHSHRASAMWLWASAQRESVFSKIKSDAKSERRGAEEPTCWSSAGCPPRAARRVRARRHSARAERFVPRAPVFTPQMNRMNTRTLYQCRHQSEWALDCTRRIYLYSRGGRRVPSGHVVVLAAPPPISVREAVGGEQVARAHWHDSAEKRRIVRPARAHIHFSIASSL